MSTFLDITPPQLYNTTVVAKKELWLSCMKLWLSYKLETVEIGWTPADIKVVLIQKLVQEMENLQALMLYQERELFCCSVVYAVAVLPCQEQGIVTAI